MQSGLTSNGKVNDQTLQKAQEFGYTILADDYYTERAGTSFPAEPNDIESPSNASRNAAFTCFRFSQRPRAQRPDAEAIVIKGSCDGALSDWTASKIIEVPMPQLRFARGFNGKVRCHKLAAPIFIKLFEAWERADLLHLIVSYDGCFVPRYKRKQAPPGAGGHGEKQSVDVSALSNHSFGSAFDINFSDNMLDQVPALCGGRGSTRELVAAANALKVFWGGYFSTQDGMHFEISRLPQ